MSVVEGLLCLILLAEAAWIVVSHVRMRRKLRQLERQIAPETEPARPAAAPMPAQPGVHHLSPPRPAVDPFASAGMYVGECACGERWEGSPETVLDAMDRHKKLTASRRRRTA